MKNYLKFFMYFFFSNALFFYIKKINAIDFGEVVNFMMPQVSSFQDRIGSHFMQQYLSSLQNNISKLPSIDGIITSLDAEIKKQQTQYQIEVIAAKKKIAANKKNLNEYYEKIINYLNTISNIPNSANLTIFEAPIFDQKFSKNIIAVPGGAIWHNPFNLNNKQWEYLGNNTFKNNIAVDFKADVVKIVNGLAENMQNSAINNMIFAEYSTQAPYSIEFEVELLSYNTPCFIGILFNKSRWLSGNLNFSNRGRLLGFYIDEASDCNLAFIENFPAITNLNNFVDPLNQLLADKYYNLSEYAKESLILDKAKPNSFSFKIFTSPQSVSFLLENLSNAKNIKNKEITLKNLNPDFFKLNCNGIGFIAVGAVATFKLISPVALLAEETDSKIFSKDSK